MYFNQSMILKTLFPGLIRNIPNNENKVFLTFDDGPDPEMTPWVLDVLNLYKAKATFFCLGKNVERHPDIFQRIKDEGHAVGNHSYSHLNGWRTKNKEYFKDIECADKLIQSNLFRPPYGRIKPSQIRVLKEKYKIVMWDNMIEDYNNKELSKSDLHKLLLKSQSGSILVLHDKTQSKGNLIFALPRILKNLHKKKFKFMKIII